MSRREAELRAVVSGPDRLVRVGVDTERDANEYPLHSRPGSERGLVGRVENDCGALDGRIAQEVVVLVVAVYDDLLAAKARCASEGQLACGGDIRTDSLLPQQAHDRHVGEGFRPEGDVPAGHCRLQ